MEINVQYILGEQQALAELRAKESAADSVRRNALADEERAGKNERQAGLGQEEANKRCRQMQSGMENAGNEVHKQRHMMEHHKAHLAKVIKLNKDAETARQQWIDKALETFRKAALVGVRIDMYSDSISLSMASPSGIYVQQRYKAGLNSATASPDTPSQVNDDTKVKSSVRKDLVARARILYPYWKKYDLAVRAYWNFVNQLVKDNELAPYNGTPTNARFTENYTHTLNVGQQKELEKYIANEEQYRKGISDADAALKKAQAAYASAQAAHGNAHKAVADAEAGLAAIRKLIREKEAEIERAKKILAELDPIEANFSIPESLGTDIYDQRWLNVVKKAAARRPGLPFMPAGGKYIDCTGKENLIVMTGGSTQMNDLKQLVTTYLLAFPVRRVHVNIIEHKVTVPQMLHDLNKAVCDVVSDNGSEWNSFIARIREKYRELEKNTSTYTPSEIVVLTGYDEDMKRQMKDLEQILNDGTRRGIYFVVLPAANYDFTKDAYYGYFNRTGYSSNYCLERKAVREELDEDASQGGRKVMKKVSTTLEKLVVQYIESCCTTIENKVYEGIAEGKLYTRTPIKDLFTEQPNSAANTLVVPFAESTDGREMDLRFATVDHFSTFIIGRSGSGKSYLLHNILTNMMLKYDSSIVELIVMDFKEGGVELDYYRDVPHVSKLLVNGRDRQIVNEIMESIDREMRRRGEVLNEIGEKDIDGYNRYAREHGMAQMKHLVVFADECHRLFASDNTTDGERMRDRNKEIVANIARQGRSQGVNLVFATQLYSGSGIPTDAIKQFSDFLLMNCTSEDVLDCGITNDEVKNRVGRLLKGQVIHYSGGAFQQGFVYDYAGPKEEYKKKTAEVLHSARYEKPKARQVYFNACQRFYMESEDLRALATRNSRIPVALLGRSLTVKGDGMLVKFKKETGYNMLIMGINKKLQAERVLWSAVMSLFYSHKSVGRPAQFNILYTFPEEEDDIQELASLRHSVVKRIGRLPGMNLVDEDERGEAIERVGKMVRERMAGASTDESVYLILPNQEYYCRSLRSRLKGLPSAQVQMEKPSISDSLGFETPKSSLGFAGIDKGSGVQSVSTSRAVGSTSETLQEELQFIMNNGPEVRVHTIIQVSSPDKVFPSDSLSPRVMNDLFTDIVLLKIGGWAQNNLPQGVAPKQVEALSDDIKSLRALVYNPDEGLRTFVPYDFPVENDSSSQKDIFELLTD